MKTVNYVTPELLELELRGTEICYESTKGAGSISEGESVDWNWQNSN